VVELEAADEEETDDLTELPCESRLLMLDCSVHGGLAVLGVESAEEESLLRRHWLT